MNTVRWEYLSISVGGKNSYDMMQELTAQGEKGWELACVVRTDALSGTLAAMRVVFKARELEGVAKIRVRNADDTPGEEP